MTEPLRDLDDVNRVLAGFIPRTGMKVNYTLDRMRALLKHCDSPQEDYPIVHVAGTSGKTSTSYFLRGILESKGIRTGLSVSPHINSVTERVQIGGHPLAPQEFADLLNRFLEKLESFGEAPTYFEVLMAFAFWCFRELKVQLAVVETGLGGLLDGSNTINRPDKICLITDIGLDHTEILGETLPEIARQKAGIIQLSNTVLVSAQDPDVVGVIEDTAKAKGASFELVEPVDAPVVRLAKFQQRNWDLACAAWNVIAGQFGMSSNLSELDPISFQPPGRAEPAYFEDEVVILDGAHNPQKLKALGEALSDRGLTPVSSLVNFIDAPEHKIASCFHELASWCDIAIIPAFSQSQDLLRGCIDPGKAAQLARSAGIKSVEVAGNVEEGLHQLRGAGGHLVVTGSLYLVAEARRHVKTMQ